MTTTSAEPGATVPYRVVCVEIVAVGGERDHLHVVGMETDSAEGAPFRWTLVQAVASIRDGEVFVIGGAEGEEAAVLEPVVCTRCRQVTLTSYPPDALLGGPRCG